MPPVPINLWSQAHSVGLIAPNFSARVSRSDIKGVGPAVLVAVDCMRPAESVVAERNPAVVADTAATGIAALAAVVVGSLAVVPVEPDLADCKHTQAAHSATQELAISRFDLHTDQL